MGVCVEKWYISYLSQIVVHEVINKFTLLFDSSLYKVWIFQYPIYCLYLIYPELRIKNPTTSNFVFGLTRNLLEGSANFLKIRDPSPNSRHQKGDMKQIL